MLHGICVTDALVHDRGEERHDDRTSQPKTRGRTRPGSRSQAQHPSLCGVRHADRGHRDATLLLECVPTQGVLAAASPDTRRAHGLIPRALVAVPVGRLPYACPSGEDPAARRGGSGAALPPWTALGRADEAGEVIRQALAVLRSLTPNHTREFAWRDLLPAHHTARRLWQRSHALQLPLPSHPGDPSRWALRGHVSALSVAKRQPPNHTLRSDSATPKGVPAGSTRRPWSPSQSDTRIGATTEDTEVGAHE
jgi:hypothetical protein